MSTRRLILILHKSSRRRGRTFSCTPTPNCKKLISFAAVEYERQIYSLKEVAEREAAKVSIEQVVSTSIRRWEWQKHRALSSRSTLGFTKTSSNMPGQYSIQLEREGPC